MHQLVYDYLLEICLVAKIICPISSNRIIALLLLQGTPTPSLQFHAVEYLSHDNIRVLNGGKGCVVPRYGLGHGVLLLLVLLVRVDHKHHDLHHHSILQNMIIFLVG